MTGKLIAKEVLAGVISYLRKEGNGEGGGLHIVLADRNISDKFVQWCIDECIANGDLDGRAIGEQLLLLSKTQRLKISHTCWAAV